MPEKGRVQDRTVQQAVFLIHVEATTDDRDPPIALPAWHRSRTALGRGYWVAADHRDASFLPQSHQKIGEELTRRLIIGVEVERDPHDVGNA